MGAAKALPIIVPVGVALALAGRDGAGVCVGGGDFFLKKLNIVGVLRITPFYETPNPLS
jgi:hypothetical protein